jgi:hypothetical protein
MALPSAAKPSARLIKELEMNEGKMMKAKGRNAAKAEMARAGMPKALAAHAAKPAAKAHAGLKSGGKVKKYAAGGLAAGHKDADGIAQRGKTKGAEIKMAQGGMYKKGGMCK